MHLGNGYKLQFVNVNGLYGCKSPALFNYNAPAPLNFAEVPLIQPTEEKIDQCEGGVGSNVGHLPVQNYVLLPSEDNMKNSTEEIVAQPTEDGAARAAPNHVPTQENLLPTKEELNLEGGKPASVAKKKRKPRSN